MDIKPDQLLEMFNQNVLPGLLRLLGALAIWIIGRKLIGFAVQLAGKGLEHNKFDPTLVRYAKSIISGMLTLFLVLGMLDFIGISTTSFAALAAGAGLAIGAAWSGMLSNFAGGVFMILMRPFKVGDLIHAAGVVGYVSEIGLFATTLNTELGVHTSVGNGKIFDDILTNFSANPTRVLAIEFHLAHGTDFHERVSRLDAELEKIEHVIPGTARVQFERFTPHGPKLFAEVTCKTADFIPLRTEVAAAIQRVFGDMGFGNHLPPVGADE